MTIKMATQTEVAEVDEEHEPASEVQPAEDGSAENDGATTDEDAATVEEEESDYDDGSADNSDSVVGRSDIDGGSDTANASADWLTYEATAYIALCDSGCSGVTATGIDVRGSIYHGGDRIIAVDPSSIALGSRVEIRLADGTTFTAQAQDTGGAIKGAKIDVLVATEAEAWDFGRQSVEVRILE
ncbi:3D domain-containing protein [Alkalihalobacillus clausii]|uniref:3D domain-containing protein n=1 Tax=Shouchella clausii TaxID=79880 RepID=UPI001C227821|nr:3D domain-containing protein [Shouchella clausii]MBU8597346.1 3D domain-containing protein [Shouchella clausii]